MRLSYFGHSALRQQNGECIHSIGLSILIIDKKEGHNTAPLLS